MKISLDSTDCQNIALCSRQLISVSSRENYCCLEGSTQWHNRANLVFICCFDAGTLQLWIRRDVVIFAQRCDNIREWRNHSKITYDEKVFLAPSHNRVSEHTSTLTHKRASQQFKEDNLLQFLNFFSSRVFATTSTTTLSYSMWCKCTSMWEIFQLWSRFIQIKWAIFFYSYEHDFKYP